MAIHPALGNLGNLALLRPSDGLQRTSKNRAGPCFYLDESHDCPFPNDEIDLEPANSEAVVYNSVAHPLQVPLRYQLAGQSSPVARVCPCGRVRFDWHGAEGRVSCGAPLTI